MVVQMMLYSFDIGIVLDDSTNAARKASDIVLTVQGLRAVFQRKNNGRSNILFWVCGVCVVCVWRWGEGGGLEPLPRWITIERRREELGSPSNLFSISPIYFRSIPMNGYHYN